MTKLKNAAVSDEAIVRPEVVACGSSGHTRALAAHLAGAQESKIENSRKLMLRK